MIYSPQKPLLDRIEFSYALWEYECKIRQKSYLAAAGVNRDLSPSSTALKSCVIESTAEAMQRLSPTMSTNALRRRIPALCVSLLPVNPVSRGHMRGNSSLAISAIDKDAKLGNFESKPIFSGVAAE